MNEILVYMSCAIFAISHPSEKNYPKLGNKQEITQVFFRSFSRFDFLLTGLIYILLAVEGYYW